jgi:hypothetical protein
MSLEHSPERGDDKKKSSSIGADLVPPLNPLGPSITVTQFCAAENIARPTCYGLPDKPGGYYIGDSYRIPPCEHLAWRERRKTAAPEIAARQSEAARARSAAGVAAKKNKKSRTRKTETVGSGE